MTLTTNRFGRMPARDYRHWASGGHSAFRAFMLLIEGNGPQAGSRSV